MPLSTSTPVRVLQGNQQTTDSAPDESPFQQVIPSIPQQSLYPSLAALETSVNMIVSPSIPFYRRVINDIEEQQRKAFEDTVEGTIRSTNTLPTSEVVEQKEKVITLSVNPQAGATQADTQEEAVQLESSEIEDTEVKKVNTQEDQNTGPTEVQNTGDTDEREVLDLIDSQTEEEGTTPENDGDDYISNDQDPAMQDNQTSKASQDNYHTAIGDDDLDDTVQFGNPVTQPFLSRSVRVPTTEVGCLSLTQMFQDYLHEYPPLSQADALLQIQEMAQRLDVYLNRYPAQYINCMTSDSEFIAFANHTIQLALDLMAYPNIWAVLSILLETRDVNHHMYRLCMITTTNVTTQRPRNI